MFKTIIFDADGMVIHREMYFSQRFSQKFEVPLEKVMPFFKKEFQLCVIGKADLKQELTPYLLKWKYNKSVDELLKFWFEHESALDNRLLASVKALRDIDVGCYLATNNENYRTEYLSETLGLKTLFDGIFSSAQLGFVKSEQSYWSAIYDHLGKPDKATILAWDDDEENVAAAKNWGFHAELYSDFDTYQKQMKLLITWLPSGK